MVYRDDGIYLHDMATNLGFLQFHHLQLMTMPQSHDATRRNVACLCRVDGLVVTGTAQEDVM